MSQDCSLLHLGQNSYSLPFSMILLADFPLPSGNLTQPWNYIMVNSHSYVSLLEGSSLVSVRSLGRTNDSLRDSHFAGYWTRPCSSKQFVFCFFFKPRSVVFSSYFFSWLTSRISRVETNVLLVQILIFLFKHSIPILAGKTSLFA
jgi:hypothetical protein